MNGLSRYNLFKHKTGLILMAPSSGEDKYQNKTGLLPLSFRMLFVLLFLWMATSLSAKAQSYMQPAAGYQVQEVLAQFSTFSSFDVAGSVLYANTGNQIKGFNLESGQEIFSTNRPAGYNGWPSFVAVSPDGAQLWAGFTTSGNTDDRIFRIDLATGQWHHKATLAGNMDLNFTGNAILVSGPNSSNWSDPNAIFLLDTVANNHRKIIETGGSPAGFSMDGQGNLYYATYFFSGSNGLYRWAAQDIADVIDQPGLPYLTLSSGTQLSGLPSGAYDCSVDDAGNVLFNSNHNPDKFIALWNGNPGNGLNYQVLASTSDGMDWLTYIHARGDITLHGPGNEAFLLGFGRPIVSISKTPPSIVALPQPNIMGYVGQQPLVIDLADVFETLSEGTPAYEVTFNAFGNVVQTQLQEHLLTLTFLEAGQTRIHITATHNNHEAVADFLTGAMPVIEGDYHFMDFSELNLAQESFWNGSDLSGGFETDLLFFPNSYNTQWGSWMGWAYSNITDNTTPGFDNQYSAITGRGMDGSEQEPDNYAVSFVPATGSVMKYNNPSAHAVRGMFVTNTTFAALSMKHGDSFAKKFGGETGDDPDWLKLTITGRRNGSDTQSLDFYLADYRFENNLKDYIVETWQWLELESLGKVDSLVFTLTSSDIGAWGMNTPSYFAIDHVFVIPDLAPFVFNALEDITVDANAPDLTVSLAGVFSDPDDNDEDILVTLAENTHPDLVQTLLHNGSLVLSFSPDQSGQAVITLEAISNGKSVSESFTVSVLPGTGIAAVDAAACKVFPNPTSGVVQVVYGGTSPARLSVYNPMGQQVVQNIISSGTQTLDLTGLPAGTYMVRIADQTTVRTFALIKQ